MSELVDQLNAGAVAAVAKSKLATDTTRTAVVRGLNGDGTVTCRIGLTPGDMEFERVRLVGQGVQTGDRVVIQRSAAGWVCLGPVLGVETAWRTPTLYNGMEPFGSGYQTPQVRRIGDLVTIRGVMRNGQSMDDEWPMFTIPSDCWPSSTQISIQLRSGPDTYQLEVLATGVGQTRNLPVLTSGKYLTMNTSFSLT